MYFRNEKNNTNIYEDKVNKIKLLSNIINRIKILTNYKKYICLGTIICTLIIAVSILFTYKNNKNYLIINGEEIITLYQGADYIEPGYTAYNSKKENLTNDVNIKSTLDTSKIGQYKITYTIGNTTKTRKINIIEQPIEYIYIYLKPVDNDTSVYLNIKDKYIEPGYQVFSSKGIDLTNQVKITGNVDTNKAGTYILTYSISNSNNQIISTTREVIVMDTKINLSLNSNTKTNKTTTINIEIDDNYFDYLILPDNTKITEKTYSYNVFENGTYTFKVYNKKGNYKESSIEVKNIDKIKPTGSCNGTHGNGQSIINIKAKDESGIEKYYINGKSYTSSKITINSEITKANITIYDKAGNTQNISCNLQKITSKPSSNSPSSNQEQNNSQSNNISENVQHSNNKPTISNITKDGVIITVTASSNNKEIAGYYFNYSNSVPNKNTSKYIKTNNKKIDVVRLPGTTYVWVEDINGNVSDYKTINITNDALLITTGNNYKTLKGEKLSDYLIRKNWSINELNNLIARSVRAAGIGSKKAAATAAISLQTVLAQKYGIKLPYENGGIYRKFGVSSNWGNKGMDCSAFVTWTYYNAGYNDLYIQPAYWAGWKKYDFTEENGEIGDFLVIGKTQGNRHVKLIIGKTDDAFITAEASGTTNGMVIKTHKFSKPDSYKIEKGDNFNYYYDAIDKDSYPSGF